MTSVAAFNGPPALCQSLKAMTLVSLTLVSLTLMTCAGIAIAHGSDRLLERSPLTALDPSSLNDSLLQEPDVLTERLVIPPNRPDWVLMDCSPNSAAQNDAANSELSAYDRVHQALCRQAKAPIWSN